MAFFKHFYFIWTKPSNFWVTVQSVHCFTFSIVLLHTYMLFCSMVTKTWFPMVFKVLTMLCSSTWMYSTMNTLTVVCGHFRLLFSSPRAFCARLVNCTVMWFGLRAETPHHLPSSLQEDRSNILFRPRQWEKSVEVVYYVTYWILFHINDALFNCTHLLSCSGFEILHLRTEILAFWCNKV